METTNTAPKFAKVANRVYIARTRVALVSMSGGAFETHLHMRLDGRDGAFYRVDMGCLTGWESIDSGPDSAPRTMREAKALALAWLARVRDAGTFEVARG